jgi:hypothetical protein
LASSPTRPRTYGAPMPMSVANVTHVDTRWAFPAATTSRSGTPANGYPVLRFLRKTSPKEAKGRGYDPGPPNCLRNRALSFQRR